MSELLLKNYLAGAAVAKHRLSKFGAADRTVIQSAGATDASIGVSAELDVASGGRVDVIRVGLAPVEYGGTVARGDPLTSDAQGRAVKANPAAGSRAFVAGFAEVSAVAGDIEDMRLAPGYLTTPA